MTYSTISSNGHARKVPGVGFEPTRLSAETFKASESAIPPPGLAGILPQKANGPRKGGPSTSLRSSLEGRRQGVSAWVRDEIERLNGS
jgi:hypothetical protein